MSFGDWKERGSWEALLSARKLEGRGSSRDRVDVGRFGEQGVGGVPEAATRKDRAAASPDCRGS